MLSIHAWQILISFILWNILHFLVFLFYRNFEFYKTLKKKSDFSMYHVSLAHSIIIVMLALPMLFDANLLQDKVYGYSYYGGSVLAITTGYFIWDTIVCIRSVNLHGYQFTFHALACLVMFLLSFVSFYVLILETNL